MNEKIKKELILCLLCLPLFWCCNRFWCIWRLSPDDVGGKLASVVSGVGSMFAQPLPSFHPADLLAGLIGALAVRFGIFVKSQNKKNYRQGEEYGSARFGTQKDIAPFIDPVFSNNLILTATERLSFGTPPAPKYGRTKNVLVVGGSGAGKTRFYVAPNLLQANCSFVVTDPKGGTLDNCGEFLRRKGYVIKILNLVDFGRSMHYNPFAYVHSEKDVLKLVTALIKNTSDENKKGGDQFWTQAETMLYTALVGYIWSEAPEEEKNINTMLTFINSFEIREDDEDFQNAVDRVFADLERRSPQHFAVRQYKKFKLAAGKTAKSILVSAGARLAPFDIAEVRDLLSYDDLELDQIGDCKTALFIITSDTDDTFNFISGLLYSQLFNALCERADNKYGGRLPVHVHFLLDEFANIYIPNMERLIAVMRSRELSASIIVQAESQLKARYKDSMDTIIGNCDSVLFLGGKEKSTLKEISETLGKQTIDMYNTGESRGRERSSSINYQRTGREIMTVDELAALDGSECILQLRGVRPFRSKKYDLTRHPNYKYTAEHDKRFTFHIDQYIHSRLTVDQKEDFDCYEVDAE